MCHTVLHIPNYPGAHIYSMSDYQDYKPVVFTNKNATIQNNGEAKPRRIVSKHIRSVNAATTADIGASTVRKLDDSTSSTKHAKVSHSFSRALLKARGCKKMTQFDLATATNQPLRVIKDYESGKAIPHGQIINKLNTILGVKLPSAKK
jgi:ribosome-binding protein aMBF1 (putative translation factor)